ncbi:MAG: YbaN family protein [Alistipes sp.]|nr:YbaN family protein [Alistipes sp.]
MKIVLIILGVVSLTLGLIGIFLPLLPTTPLLLLAAWCFVRSSERLYRWLVSNRYFGEYIRNFRENRAIPLHAKVVAVSMIWLTIGFCVVVILDKWLLRIMLLAVAVAVTWHILSYATLHKKGEK